MLRYLSDRQGERDPPSDGTEAVLGAGGGRAGVKDTVRYPEPGE